MSVDAYACLVFPVSEPTDLRAAGWAPGPLPLPLPQPLPPPLIGATSGETPRADRRARAGHFAERVHDLLYGPADPAAPAQRRWHRSTVEPDLSPHGAVLDACELLRSDDDGRWLAVAHVRLGDDPVHGLAALHEGGADRDWLIALFAGVAPVTGRTRHVVHVTWNGTRMPEPVDDPGAMAALEPWTTLQRWQWFAGSGTSPELVLPDVDEPGLLDGTVHLSADWCALALRSGIAYVARTPCPATGMSFHDLARVYVRTIHLDVLLLGTLQLDTVHHYADRVAASRLEQLDAAGAVALEAELLDLGTRLMWNNLGLLGRQTSDVLLAFQRQHHLPELHRQITSHLADVSRYIQARTVAAEEAARRQEDVRNRQLDHFVGIVSFVFLPMSLVFGAAALLSEPSLTAFVSSLAAATVTSGLVFAAFRLARRGSARKSADSRVRSRRPSTGDSG